MERLGKDNFAGQGTQCLQCRTSLETNYGMLFSSKSPFLSWLKPSLGTALSNLGGYGKTAGVWRTKKENTEARKVEATNHQAEKSAAEPHGRSMSERALKREYKRAKLLRACSSPNEVDADCGRKEAFVLWMRSLRLRSGLACEDEPGAHH